MHQKRRQFMCHAARYVDVLLVRHKGLYLSLSTQSEACCFICIMKAALKCSGKFPMGPMFGPHLGPRNCSPPTALCSRVGVATTHRTGPAACKSTLLTGGHNSDEAQQRIHGRWAVYCSAGS